MRNQVVTKAEYYHLGGWQAAWIVVAGSSSNPYRPGFIKCVIDERPLSLPTDVLKRKEQIEADEALKESIYGKREFFNGRTLALEKVLHSEVDDSQPSSLILQLRPSEYYNFLSTAISLDEIVLGPNGERITLRDKYLSKVRYDEPIPEFATALPINLSVITNDGFILASKRGTDGIGGYRGHIAPAISEIISPVSDVQLDGSVSVFSTAKRGARNELNIETTDDEVLFFTIGVDAHWYFWGLTGLIRTTKFSKADILARRSLGSEERWESKELYFFPSNVGEAVREMRELSTVDKWQPVAIVCTIQALISEHGIEETEIALKKHPPV